MKSQKLLLITAATFLSLAAFSQTDSTKTDTTTTQTDTTMQDSTHAFIQRGVNLPSGSSVSTNVPQSQSGENQQTFVADFRRYYILPKTNPANRG